jgi:hypothetical protein
MLKNLCFLVVAVVAGGKPEAVVVNHVTQYIFLLKLMVLWIIIQC